MMRAQPFSAGSPVQPLLHSADDLRRAMRQAARGEVAQRATTALDRVLGWDAARALVEVQSGTPWPTLAARLAQQIPEFEAAVWHGSPAGSVGDAVAVNAPGPDGQPVVALVEALTLVTADGELRHASRVRDPALFALAVGGHGVFGTAYSVTFRVDALALAARRARSTETLQPRADVAGASRSLVLLLPPARQAAFIEAACAIADDWRTPITRIDVMQTLAEHETRLRWAKQAYAALTLRLALPRRLGACVRVAQACSALIDCALAHGGSFAIGATRDATRAQLETAYPELRSVLAEQLRRDPEERLCNAWYRHHRRVLDGVACDVRWNPPQAASA